MSSSSTEQRRPVRRALVSVYDKTGLEELASALHAADVAIVSTGSTARTIAAAGIPVTPVEEVTGFPECLDGRVKTLHPRVHAGILADTTSPDHVRELEELGVEGFELVVVNLYPFRDTVMSGATPQECIEQIDIGGPTMVRAAAKNHASVAVLTDPAAYSAAVAAVNAGGFTLAERRRLAARAFAHTAAYDVAVASWFASVLAPDSDRWPDFAGATWDRKAVLRYGENPHQHAAVYTHGRPGIASAEQLHGKEMSYNNFVDADAAVRAAHDHGDRPTVAIIKHANPCGIAIGSDIADAYAKAHDCDPVSAYGGIIAANQSVTAAMATAAKDVFTEVIVAPDFEPEALAILTVKKNLRILRLPADMREAREPVEFRPISGGILAQTVDRLDAVVKGETPETSGGDDPSRWRLVSGEPADEATLRDLAFAWRSVRAVKSNAILLAKDGASVGVGMGQVNRVDACHLAVTRAGDNRVKGSVAASDAFFPFADGLQILLDAGVRAVVAPGGSIRDDVVIEATTKAGATLYFTGTRHFFH